MDDNDLRIAINENDLWISPNDKIIAWGKPEQPSLEISANNALELSENTALGENFIKAMKKSLGFVDRPLVKCSHCGQWGAVYCACTHCGAPIDPE